MTSKFIGKFTFDAGQISKVVETETIPEKKLWNNYSIWEFNGKRYRPVTKNATEDLESLVKEIQNAGYTAARKQGKIKPSSIKYAICTTGVEDFKLVK